MRESISILGTWIAIAGVWLLSVCGLWLITGVVHAVIGVVPVDGMMVAGVVMVVVGAIVNKLSRGDK